MKKTPFIDYFTLKGYSPQEKDGVPYFGYYTSKDEELALMHTGVGFRDLSASTTLILRGADVLDFLHRITTNDLKNLQPFRAAYTIFTTDKGRILDRVLVVNHSDYYLLLGNRDTADILTRWITKYTITDDVHVKNAYGEAGVFEVLGQQSEAFLILLFGDQVKDLKPGEVKRVFLERSYYTLITINGGEDKRRYIITAPFFDCKFLLEYCIHNGSLFDFHFIGEDAYEEYRIEQGIPTENELNDNFNPHEALLLKDVCFTKGCYIGQEVIARLDTYQKVSKYLRGIELNTSELLPTPFPIINSESNEIGTVTSLTFSSRRDKVIGLAYIRKQYAEENTHIETHHDGKLLKTVVKQLPFND